MKITLAVLTILSICLLSLAYSFTNNKFSTPEKTFLTFQKALRGQNYKLAWQCISENAKKKWPDFQTFKEHSNLHVFEEGKQGLLQAEIVMNDIIGNTTFLIIKTSNLARVELVKEKGKWKIKDMVRVKEISERKMENDQL